MILIMKTMFICPSMANIHFTVYSIKKTKSGDCIGLQWATLPSTQHRGRLQACLLEHGDAEVDLETNVL